MYFLSESMSFLRIVQIIDVKAKKFDALEYSTRPSRKPAKTIKEQAIFIPRIDRQQKTARKTIHFPVDNKKKHMFRHDAATDIERNRRVWIVSHKNRHKQIPPE